MLRGAGYELTADRLKWAVRYGDDLVGLRIADRLANPDVLDEPPEGLVDLRGVLASEHRWRIRHGLVRLRSGRRRERPGSPGNSTHGRHGRDMGAPGIEPGTFVCEASALPLSYAPGAPRLAQHPGIVLDDRHLGAAVLDAVHADVGAADHEVGMDTGVVVAVRRELPRPSSLLAAVDRPLDPLSPRDVAGGIFVEQRVEEHDPGLAAHGSPRRRARPRPGSSRPRRSPSLPARRRRPTRRAPRRPSPRRNGARARGRSCRRARAGTSTARCPR